MFTEIKPYSTQSKLEEYVSFYTSGYLVFSSALRDHIGQAFHYPDKVNILVDEEEKILRMQFLTDGKYTINHDRSVDKISFQYGRRKLYIKPQRYKDITFGPDYIDMRYVCR